MQLAATPLGLVPVVGVAAVGAVDAAVDAAAVAAAAGVAAAAASAPEPFAHAGPLQGRARGLCRCAEGRLGRDQHQCCESTWQQQQQPQ